MDYTIIELWHKVFDKPIPRIPPASCDEELLAQVEVLRFLDQSEKILDLMRSKILKRDYALAAHLINELLTCFTTVKVGLEASQKAKNI